MNPPFEFHATIKVRYNETDLQGHVNFMHYYAYFDVGVIEYMEAIGYGYETMLAEGTDLLYAESHCEYKSSAKWPEVLRVYTRLGHIGQRSLRFEFEIRAEIDKRFVAQGYIVAVTANRDTFEVHSIPDSMRKVLEQVID
jgi:acyl-CoA thioester hydrolase